MLLYFVPSSHNPTKLCENCLVCVSPAGCGDEQAPVIPLLSACRVINPNCAPPKKVSFVKLHSNVTIPCMRYSRKIMHSRKSKNNEYIPCIHEFGYAPVIRLQNDDFWQTCSHSRRQNGYFYIVRFLATDIILKRNSWSNFAFFPPMDAYRGPCFAISSDYNMVWLSL